MNYVTDSQHVYNCVSYKGSRPPRRPGSIHIAMTDQTNLAIVISAEGNHCRGTDPAENRALIAIALKPNVIATDKSHPKVPWKLSPVKCPRKNLQCIAEYEKGQTVHRLPGDCPVAVITLTNLI